MEFETRTSNVRT